MQRTARMLFAAGVLALTLVGCTQPSAAPVVTQPVADEDPSPSMHVRRTAWIDSTPNLYREVPITEDLPTFPMTGQESFSYPGGPRLSMPQAKIQGRVDEQAVLSQIAASIDRTGRPDVPGDLPAAFAGKLEGDHYVYSLGGVPKEPDGELVFMLTKKTDGWEAAPICRHSWAWVWPGTTQQTKDPVVICAYIEGSGANLYLAAYKAGQEVLRVQGLSDSYVQVIADPNGGVPTIIAYGGQQWLDHKAEPRVVERYVFTWQNDSYVLTRQERRNDWVCHLARLIAFLAAREPEHALVDFAEPPPGGVQAYIDQVAPDLRDLASGRWTTAGAPLITEWPPTRAYLRLVGWESGPWFIFDFDQQGLIKSAREQVEPPK